MEPKILAFGDVDRITKLGMDTCDWSCIRREIMWHGWWIEVLYVGFVWGNLREGHHSEDLGVDSRIILEWNLKAVESARTGLIWLRIWIKFCGIWNAVRILQCDNTLYKWLDFYELLNKDCFLWNGFFSISQYYRRH